MSSSVLGSNHALPLPIPPYNQILLYSYFYWNNLKEALDTATKLFWNCQVKFTSKSKPQIVILLAKFFQLFAINLHCRHCVATAETNLNLYVSLHHFQKSRNIHYPFLKTLSRSIIQVVDQES